MCIWCFDEPSATVAGEHGVLASKSPDSRRLFLKSGLALAAGTTISAVPMARAQTPSAATPELAKLQASRRICLKGGIVLSMDRQVGDFAVGDVLIEDGKIREVGRNINVSAESAAIVDASRRIVMPGFVDTHHHFYQGLLRSILTNGLLNPDYTRDIGRTLTSAYQPSDVYAGSLVTALGMMEMGTTLAVDTSQASHTPEHTDSGIKALQDAGIRAVYAYWTGTGAGVRYPTDAGRLRKTYFQTPDQLLTLALGSVLDPKAFAYAREAGLRIVSHGVDKNREPRLHELDRAGLLREGDVLIHCNDLSSDAWKIIRDRGLRVSLSPPIEMTMGHGIPGIQGALDHGIRPSLSSDVDATMAQDPFTIMRTVMTLQRMLVLQRERAGEKNLPPLLTCRDVLEFATIAGARCANLDSKVGSLTPGKEADVILLKTDMLNVWPINNAPGAVVNIMNPGHVESVFIAGKARKWRGQLVGVDTSRVLQMAQEARDGVVRRSGFQADLLR